MFAVDCAGADWTGKEIALEPFLAVFCFGGLVDRDSYIQMSAAWEWHENNAKPHRIFETVSGGLTVG